MLSARFAFDRFYCIVLCRVVVDKKRTLFRRFSLNFSETSRVSVVNPEQARVLENMTPMVQRISLPACQQENKSPQCFGDRKTMWWSIEWTAFYRDHFQGRISKIAIITELSRLRSCAVQAPLPDLFRCSVSDNRSPYSDSVSYLVQYKSSPEPVIGHELESISSTQSLQISLNDVLPSPWSSTWMLSRKCRHELPVLNFEAYCCYRGVVNLSVAWACS